jgi:hypothetical protein
MCCSVLLNVKHVNERRLSLLLEEDRRTFLAMTMEGLSMGVLLAISISSLFSWRGIASF